MREQSLDTLREAISGPVLLPRLLEQHNPLILSLCLIPMIWGSSFVIQVPLHSLLERSNSEHFIYKLIRTNRIRTLV